MSAGHGPNVGHGYVKYVIIDSRGQELTPVVFPALVARAGGVARGALAAAPTIDLDGAPYWTGEDALLSPTPLSILAQERLADPIFIPALVRGALARASACHEVVGDAVAVTGLPATWSEDLAMAQQLGARLRAAAHFDDIRVIPEPLGLLYSKLLDNDGREAGDPSLASGRWLVCDWGHRTDDEVIVDRRCALRGSLRTDADTASAAALDRIAQHLSVVFERDFTLYEVDQAIRDGGVWQFGELRPLPPHWDRPLLDLGAAAAARMVNRYRRERLDGILVGGGGAAEERKMAAVRAKFPHLVVAERPQLAIAVGYARLARRFAAEDQG